MYVSGDAYVDHPSFGTAIISRLLEARGYKVGIISQPDWKDKRALKAGRPRLGFLVSAGNMDSMVNHSFRVQKTAEGRFLHTPGGVMGKRPDYAVVVYCNLITVRV